MSPNEVYPYADELIDRVVKGDIFGIPRSAIGFVSRCKREEPLRCEASDCPFRWAPIPRVRDVQDLRETIIYPWHFL